MLVTHSINCKHHKNILDFWVANFPIKNLIKGRDTPLIPRLEADNKGRRRLLLKKFVFILRLLHRQI